MGRATYAGKGRAPEAILQLKIIVQLLQNPCGLLQIHALNNWLLHAHGVRGIAIYYTKVTNRTIQWPTDVSLQGLGKCRLIIVLKVP
jgi:hypothetical protein